MYEWSSWRTLVVSNTSLCSYLELSSLLASSEFQLRLSPGLRSFPEYVADLLQPMMLGIFGLLGFVVYSVYWSSEPLIRRSLFNSPTAITAYAGTFIHGIMVWSLLY